MDTRKILSAVSPSSVQKTPVNQAIVTNSNTSIDVHTIFSPDGKAIQTNLNPFGGLIGNKWDDVFDAWSKICDLDFHLQVFDAYKQNNPNYLFTSNTSTALKDVDALLFYLKSEKNTLLRYISYLKNRNSKQKSIRINFDGRVFGNICILKENTIEEAIALFDSTIIKLEKILSSEDREFLESTKNRRNRNPCNNSESLSLSRRNA